MATTPQPVTYTADSINRVLSGLFDVRNTDHPVARMTTPDDYVFAARVQLAVSSVCAGLTPRCRRGRSSRTSTEPPNR